MPAALPASSMAKTATMANMASATHVVLMATSVVADILMLYDDDGVDVERVVMDAHSVSALRDAGSLRRWALRLYSPLRRL